MTASDCGLILTVTLSTVSWLPASHCFPWEPSAPPSSSRRPSMNPSRLFSTAGVSTVMSPGVGTDDGGVVGGHWTTRTTDR